MAGHSKWSNIKRRKGAQDQKRGKIFSRIIKEITVAIKDNNNNGDPESNPALRNALLNAKGVNMPKDNIERAIKKAMGADGANYEHITFEGYGPHGIAFFIECTTDNTNRTVANIRAIFNKHNGTLGTNGSLEFIFDRKGVFTLNKANIDIDLEELQLELIEFGADTFEDEKETFTIYTEFTDFGMMSQKLEELNIEVESAQPQRIPNSTKELDIEKSKSILKMVDAFEEDDDVQNVFHNLEATDELMASLSED
ncbi:MAG TPA: YebC/PmpR family DNA-binding transcriptional regulator [Chitinophagales bacterium]|nr:YebC/PmpR family DNA-binding transcriptional regulator [Chitinophagales bacterium]